MNRTIRRCSGLSQKTKALLIVAIAGLQATACHSNPKDETSLAEPSGAPEYRARLQNFDASGSFIEVKQKVHKEYKALRTDLALPEACSNASDEKAVALWNILTWAAFYTLEADYADRAFDCLEMMRGKDLDSPFFARTTHYSLAINFRGRAAESVRTQYPELELPALPAIHDKRTDSMGIPVLHLARAGAHSADLVSVPLQGESIIVIASGTCAFSQKAAQEIAKDDDLRNALRDAHWMAPPYDILSVAETQSWNAKYPALKLSIMYGFSKLEQLRVSTPTFVHMRDGVIIEKLSGWRGANDKEKLRKMLQGSPPSASQL